MFPEGTRQREGLAKRRQARPHTGAARIALEAGVPLVPAAIAAPTGSRGSGRCASPTASRSPLDDLAGLDQSEAARDRRPTG